MCEVSAYHEAGHALMALYVGARVRSISLAPEPGEGPDRYAEVAVEWPRDQFSPLEFQTKSVRVALAGPAAEMIHRGEPLHPGVVSEWAADWQAAWESSGSLVTGPAQRLAYLEQMTRQVYHWLDQPQHWAALAAIVDHLLAHEYLEREEIEEIVAPWLR